MTADSSTEPHTTWQPRTPAIGSALSMASRTLAEVERRYVNRVLSILGGNKTRAAEVLGIDRRTLHRKIDRWEGGSSSS